MNAPDLCRTLSRFTQVKEEGWYLVLGEPSTHELMALKRVSLESKSTVKMTVPRRNGAGRMLSAVRLYLMSDSYLGLDQMYDVGVGSVDAPTPSEGPSTSAEGASSGTSRASASAVAADGRERLWQRKIEDGGAHGSDQVEGSTGRSQGAGHSSIVPVRGPKRGSAAVGGRNNMGRDTDTEQVQEDEPPCG